MITEPAKTLFLHAQCYWLEFVDMMFWLFAVCAAIERFHCLQLDLDGNLPNSEFFNTKNIPLSVHDYITFGCPMYNLDL